MHTGFYGNVVQARTFERVDNPSWASTPAVRRSMQANKSRDTQPELRLRSALHAMGLRYRVCTRPIPQLRRTVDVVFGPSRVAVEVRGCFWHGCPLHYRQPQRNDSFWQAKLERNMTRDAEIERALEARGWELIVVWEHEPVEEAAELIRQAVTRRRPANRQAVPGE